MDKDNQEDKGRELTPEELKEMRNGQALEEITKMPGWSVILRMLNDRAYHSWADPRETGSEKEWLWRELNSFHSADVSKQLLLDVQSLIDRSDYLDKVLKGEIDQRRMKI